MNSKRIFLFALLSAVAVELTSARPSTLAQVISKNLLANNAVEINGNALSQLDTGNHDGSNQTYEARNPAPADNDHSLPIRLWFDANGQFENTNNKTIKEHNHMFLTLRHVGHYIAPNGEEHNFQISHDTLTYLDQHFHNTTVTEKFLADTLGDPKEWREVSEVVITHDENGDTWAEKKFEDGETSTEKIIY